jgi:hypothetical protein
MLFYENDRNRIEILMCPNDIFPANSVFFYYFGLSAPALTINRIDKLEKSFCIAGFESTVEKIGRKRGF